MTEPIRFLAIADSDSYVKWGAALLGRTPSSWDRRLVVVETPVLPSNDQLTAALATTGRGIAHPVVVDLAALAARVAKTQPDVVLISVRGPLIKVVVRTITRAANSRPVIVTGLPGISIPATRKAIAHRAQADLFVLHSRREVEEFARLAQAMRIPQRFALATLPFLPDRAEHTSPTGDVIFAAQAKVPAEKSERLELLGWLAETARAQPDRHVVVKVRAARGEAQTHAEEHDYAELMAELTPPPPANLVVKGGAMSDHLLRAAGLVTVSSTAAIEAIALGRPVLVLNDFGVSRRLINTVFEDSGLLGSSRDLVAADFRLPQSEWLEQNYFHGVDHDDWLDELDILLRQRQTGDFPLKPLRYGRFGGVLRRAWDRKRALGRFDRTFTGLIALLIGMPVMILFRVVRKARRKMRRRRIVH